LSAATGGFIVDDNDDRDGVILEERIAGKSVVAIAELYQCTTSEVDAAIDRRLSFALDNDMRLRAIKLDVARLEALMVPFFERATKGDCDVSAVAAGTLCCKLLERRALLLGLDQPTQSRVDVYQVEQRKQPSQYEQIKAAINRMWEQQPPVKRALHERLHQLTPERALELLGPLEPNGGDDAGDTLSDSDNTKSRH
jgi:hypothetical protein